MSERGGKMNLTGQFKMSSTVKGHVVFPTHRSYLDSNNIFHPNSYLNPSVAAVPFHGEYRESARKRHILGFRINIIYTETWTKLSGTDISRKNSIGHEGLTQRAYDRLPGPPA